MPTTDYEKKFWGGGFSLVAGVDEVGRGALAGPVVAAAVVLSPDVGDSVLVQLDDSKKLTALQRECVFDLIRGAGVSYAVGVCPAETIDEVGILRATGLAMQSAIDGLPCPPDKLLIDGRPLAQLGKFTENATFIIKGDSVSCSIAAASIIAKVERDRILAGECHTRHPQYEFAKNKGYGTRAHLDALRKHGASPLHRRTFDPLRTMLAQKSLL